MAVPATAREIVDMIGRKVDVPDQGARVYATTPPVTLLTFSLAPESLVSFNIGATLRKLPPDAAALLPARMAQLKTLGNMMGYGAVANVEEVLAAGANLVIAYQSPFIKDEKIMRDFAAVGIPVVVVRLDDIQDYPAAYRFLGRVLGLDARAEQLARHVEDTLARVDQALRTIPPEKRRKVYYVEAPDGLTTDCDASRHTGAIRQAGGEIVYRCVQDRIEGMNRVTLEEVIALAPDTIVTLTPAFRKTVKEDPRWRSVPAVAQGRIITIPSLPFGWIDRPPSFMQALGIPWLTHAFYPEAFPMDVTAEVKAFFALFLSKEITDAEVAAILKPQPRAP